MIHKPTTILEADLAAKDSLVMQAAEATHHLASVLKSVHERFWNLSPERLIAVLNADVAGTLQTFAHNSAIGVACNASLDALDLSQFSTRAPLAMGLEGIAFDEQSGQFTYTAPPEPVPEPEPIA